jgi:hypothetical protein
VFVLHSISYKSKQFLWLVLKVFVVIGCCFFIYYKIARSKNIDFGDFYSNLINFGIFSTKNIVFLFIFTSFNWILEITKWQVLTEKIQNISWTTAAIQTLASSTLALITPIRTGEYGVKVLYYKKQYRRDIAIAAFAGNLYQLLISLAMGVLGIIYLIDYFDQNFITYVCLIFLAGIFVLLILFTLRKSVPFIQVVFQKLLPKFRFKQVSQSRKAFLLSFVRYLIFSHQFYFLITLFEIDISYLEAMSCIVSMYGLTSVVPILPLFDFLLKGSVAILLFSFFQVTPIFIISITMLMWILNFAIPSIIGSYFILRLKTTPTA